MARGVRFDEDGFVAGIRTAMTVGLPDDQSLQPLFVFADTITSTASLDADDVPYDPTARPTVTPGARLRVLCAIEYLDSHGQAVEFGILTASQLRITLLNAEYQQVKGFAYVIVDGDKYNYRRTAPPAGMVTATVWTIYASAEDET